LVEHAAENRGVGGPIPPLPTRIQRSTPTARSWPRAVRPHDQLPDAAAAELEVDNDLGLAQSHVPVKGLTRSIP
jgi:hypothetical protein